MKYKLYEVGGKVRDEFLGLQSKDIDYSVVIENTGLYPSPQDALTAFEAQIKEEGYEVFLVTDDCFTIRAKFPKNHKFAGLVADFVLARKETGYIAGTRKPHVILGTLEDDLLRRDFTVNAIAKDLDGNYIDPFGGIQDIQAGILRTPTDTVISFNDDPLRILRAIRFKITKGLELSDSIYHAISTFDPKKMGVVSEERRREELFKCFKHNTIRTLNALDFIKLHNHPLFNNILSGLWLEPTNKK